MIDLSNNREDSLIFITQEVLDVCILIPCYNNLDGLAKSIKSILYKEDLYLILVVDDGSKHKITYTEIEGKVKQDLPLQIISLPENSGITKALNFGLNWIQQNIKVKYIARLDCGDICHADRFYRQVAYLEKHTDIDLLGSWCTFKEMYSDKSYTYSTSTSHQAILREMHTRNVFIHPGVVFKSSVLDSVGLYPLNYQLVEDYAFFWQILKRGKGAVISEYLVTCEINKHGISISHRRKQLLARVKIVNDFSSNCFLRFFGLLKLTLLLTVPYRFILKLKYCKQNMSK